VKTPYPSPRFRDPGTLRAGVSAKTPKEVEVGRWESS
jgi:hypothetical protein